MKRAIVEFLDPIESIKSIDAINSNHARLTISGAKKTIELSNIEQDLEKATGRRSFVYKDKKKNIGVEMVVLWGREDTSFEDIEKFNELRNEKIRLEAEIKANDMQLKTLEKAKRGLEALMDYQVKGERQ